MPLIARMAAKGKRRRKARQAACPECGAATVIPVIHGTPSPQQQRAIRQGKAIISNREEWEGMSEWYCKACGCDWSRGWRRFKKVESVNATR
jgi:hypothetical protein